MMLRKIGDVCAGRMQSTDAQQRVQDRGMMGLVVSLELHVHTCVGGKVRDADRQLGIGNYLFQRGSILDRR